MHASFSPLLVVVIVLAAILLALWLARLLIPRKARFFFVVLMSLFLGYSGIWFYTGVRSTWEVDAETGIIRISKFFLGIKYDQDLKETFLTTKELRENFNEDEADWWTSGQYSPNPYIYLNWRMKIHSLLFFQRIIIENNEVSVSKPSLDFIRTRVFELWKEERFSEADWFVERTRWVTDPMPSRHSTLVLKEDFDPEETDPEKIFDFVHTDTLSEKPSNH